MSEVICEFANVCQNYGIYCEKCTFNKGIRLKNYLVMKKGDKTVKYLGDSNEGSQNI